MTVRIITGDCRDVLATLPAESVHCCVTSPPYFGLRDYGVEGQIGLEEDFHAYIDKLVVVFREVRRVLRSDGTDFIYAETRNRRSVWEVDEDEFEQFIAWKAAQRVRGSVWPIATQPFKQAHFATFPPALIEPCILAGCPKGGTVLDPFFGSGTTGLVADRLQRDCIGIDLNPAYADMARKRIVGDAPLFVAAE